jgi:hypothetical protein
MFGMLGPFIWLLLSITISTARNLSAQGSFFVPQKSLSHRNLHGCLLPLLQLFEHGESSGMVFANREARTIGPAEIPHPSLVKVKL